MNNYKFNNDQFSEDVATVAKFFWEFVKSFGPSQKKIVDRPIGIFEELHIRFRLMLVEMGISKIIRLVIVFIVGIIVYFVLFRHADIFFKLIIGIAFLTYYIWMLAPHLAKEMKWEGGKIVGDPVDGLTPKYLIMYYNKQLDARAYAKEKAGEIAGDVKKMFSKEDKA